MTTQTPYTPFGGGLDFTSSGLGIQPGALSDCLNFEQVYGIQGYRRIFGYERYDGRPQPHLAEYVTQTFKLGTVAFTVGEIINGPTATAQVLQITVESGTFGAGTAAGFLVLTSVTGTWANNDYIKQGSNLRATAAGATEQPDITADDHYTYLRLAREAARTVIQKVPGEGDVLGGAVYRGVVYAVRNIVGSTSATLWKSSSAGWTAVKTNLLPGGRWRFDVKNFTGDPTKLKLFGVDGKNGLLVYDGTTVTMVGPIYNSESTSTTSFTPGVGSKAFTLVEAARIYAVGDIVTAYDATDPTIFMTGNVTAWSTPTLTVNVTTFGGSGAHANWKISKADFSDKPYDLLAHADHMFLAYQRGQLQTSNIGDPLTYTTTASVFGLGDEITGLVSLKGSILAIFCTRQIALLSGTSQTDFSLAPYTDGVGAIFGTAQGNAGNAIFLDKRGVTSLQATQSFGSFAPSIFSAKVMKLVNAAIPTIIGARMTRGSYQYRLYTSAGRVITFSLMTGAATVQAKDVSPTVQEYAHQPRNFFAGDLGLEEGLFFGTSDGYVMRESVGTSFDGAEIDGVFRIPFNHYKSADYNKAFHKLDLEIEATDPVVIKFLQLFDYDDGMYDQSILQDANATSAGGQYDVSNWDEFLFSLPMVSSAEANIDGVGRNMGLIFYVTSDVVQPVIIQGMLTHFTMRGLRRGA